MSVRSRLRITIRQLEALVAFLENNKENLAENRKLLQNEAGIVGRKQMDKLFFFFFNCHSRFLPYGFYGTFRSAVFPIHFPCSFAYR
jgi:hypothetical protein